MIKVVIDANVFISSFFGGNPEKIISLRKQGEIKLCLSNKIIDEYIEVQKRMGLQDESELKELLDVLAEGHNIIFTAATLKLDIVKNDPDDNKFIECAVALECSYIVSGDNHLRNLQRYMGISILNPRAFLKELKFKPDKL